MSILKRKYKDEVTLVAINNTKETQKSPYLQVQLVKNKS